MRLVTKKQLRNIVPYSSAHIDRLEKAGEFPPRVRLGANRVGWLEAEVQEWIAAKASERPNLIEAQG